MFRARIVGEECEDAEMKIDQEMTRRREKVKSKGGDKEGAMAEGKEKMQYVRMRHQTIDKRVSGSQCNAQRRSPTELSFPISP